ncbi:MAG TPA: DUF72 domain-containing protein [Candidatus Dormibacteraeota bacterium]
MRPAAGTLFVGTSGFSYPEWRGHFYPAGLAGSKMLAHYASRLNGVELNGTFYRSPAEAALRTWAEAPVGFRFCLKGHRALTYSAAAFDKLTVARDFARRVEVLGERLGPLLLQFPPVRKKDVALLDSLLEALGRPVAAEFRDESWFDDEVSALLRSRGAAMVVTDDESWPQAPAGDYAFAYYRLRRDYSEEALAGWASRVPRDRDAYVFFKHTVEGPLRAVALARLLG